MFRVLCIFFLLSSAMASIVIDLDEEELQVIAGILIENYIDSNLTPKKNIHFAKYVKKAASNVGQFTMIMFSLVGANILTKMYEESVQLEKTTGEEINAVCDNLYGCDAGQCWRTCSDSMDTICLTEPIKKDANKKCLSATDCTQCGDCISECEKTI